MFEKLRREAQIQIEHPNIHLSYFEGPRRTVMLCKTKHKDLYARHHILIRRVYIIFSNIKMLALFLQQLSLQFYLQPKKLSEGSHGRKSRYSRLKFSSCECHHGPHVHEESTKKQEAVIPQTISWSHKACYDMKRITHACSTNSNMPRHGPLLSQAKDLWQPCKKPCKLKLKNIQFMFFSFFPF